MKSATASIIEFLTGIYELKEKFDKKRLAPDRHNKYGKPPRSLERRYRSEHNVVAGCRTYTLYSSDKPTDHLVYFHGGAYTSQARYWHWYAIKFFLKNLPCALTFVNYPLAPEATVDVTVPKVIEVYKALYKDEKTPITLMGDSAGGGLSLVMAQIIKREKFAPAPKKLVLLSPWLDVSTKVGITDELEKKDRMLSIEGLQIAGKGYAGNRDVTDPLCSPIYGDVDGLGDIAIFTGTYDLLYPDSTRLKDKLTQKKIKHAYFEYPEMQHTFMLIPMPEGLDALKKICAFIEEPDAYLKQ